jgi:hypothetical protein
MNFVRLADINSSEQLYLRIRKQKPAALLRRLKSKDDRRSRGVSAKYAKVEIFYKEVMHKI